MRYLRAVLFAALLLAVQTAAVAAKADTIRIAVTTSFENSGLADALLPRLLADTGVQVHLLVVGTGQALALARRGDVDAVLVHSREAEERLVADGFATHRRPIMTNDFLIVGPAHDPAGLKRSPTATQALSAIHEQAVPFVSRGDDSGTHRRELSLWRTAGLSPDVFDISWYREAGSGMGATLNIAAALQAHTLTDRGSWLNFANKRDLAVLFEGGPALVNPYAFLPVSSARHPHVKAANVAKVEAWLAGPMGQNAISEYRIDGVAPFAPDGSPASTATGG